MLHVRRELRLELPDRRLGRAAPRRDGSPRACHERARRELRGPRVTARVDRNSREVESARGTFHLVCIMGGMQGNGVRQAGSRVARFGGGWYTRAQARRRYRRRKALNKPVRELDAAVTVLGLSDRELTQTRSMLRADRKARDKFPVTAYWQGMLVMLIASRVAEFVLDRTRNVDASLRLGLPSTAVEWVQSAFHVIGSKWIFGAVLWTVWRLWVGIRRYLLTVRAAAAARVCAQAVQQPSGVRAVALYGVDKACRRVERQILRAHRFSGTIPARSPRRAAAKQHAALVAGALRQQLNLLDQEPEKALKDLAAGLVTIGERYAEGRVAALLPDSALEGVEPISRARSGLRESLHMVLAIGAAMGAVVVANALWPSLGVPEDVRPWMWTGIAVAAAILVAGWARVIRFLERVPV